MLRGGQHPAPRRANTENCRKKTITFAWTTLHLRFIIIHSSFFFHNSFHPISEQKIVSTCKPNHPPVRTLSLTVNQIDKKKQLGKHPALICTDLKFNSNSNTSNIHCYFHQSSQSNQTKAKDSNFIRPQSGRQPSHGTGTLTNHKPLNSRMKII